MRGFANFLLGVNLLLCSCTEADRTGDYDGNMVSIRHLKSVYRGSPVRLSEGLSVRGVVVSSDSCGNFYKELVVQDATGGISVRADATGLYRLYSQGTTVIVRCEGLTLGSYGGRLELGIASTEANYETGRIPAGQLASTVVRSRTPLPFPKPRKLVLSELKPEHIGTYVRLSPEVKIIAPPGTTWSGNRLFRAAPYGASADSILVRTAEKASFAGRPVPTVPIGLCGILSWWNGAYQLVIVRPDDLTE